MRKYRLGLVAFVVAVLASWPAMDTTAQSVPVIETVTVLVDFTTPRGNRLTGTLVVRRTCGPTIVSDGQFDGLLNGARFTASGRVIERWLGPGREEVEVIATDVIGTVLGQSPLRTVLVEQLAPGLLSVEGLPVAVDQPLREPCSGTMPAALTVTNPGQGIQPIASLPNTSGPALMRPWLIVTALLVAGALLFWIGATLRRAGRQRR